MFETFGFPLNDVGGCLFIDEDDVVLIIFSVHITLNETTRFSIADLA